jgi:hypothetical protein
MLNVPRFVVIGSNEDTRIVQRYFDLDKNEFMSEDERDERYDDTFDYRSESHHLDREHNEHQVLWIFSKEHFQVNSAIKEVKKISFGEE